LIFVVVAVESTVVDSLANCKPCQQAFVEQHSKLAVVVVVDLDTTEKT